MKNFSPPPPPCGAPLRKRHIGWDQVLLKSPKSEIQNIQFSLCVQPLPQRLQKRLEPCDFSLAQKLVRGFFPGRKAERDFFCDENPLRDVRRNQGRNSHGIGIVGSHLSQVKPGSVEFQGNPDRKTHLERTQEIIQINRLFAVRILINSPKRQRLRVALGAENVKSGTERIGMKENLFQGRFGGLTDGFARTGDSQNYGERKNECGNWNFQKGSPVIFPPVFPACRRFERKFRSSTTRLRRGKNSIFREEHT